MKVLLFQVAMPKAQINLEMQASVARRATMLRLSSITFQVVRRVFRALRNFLSAQHSMPSMHALRQGSVAFFWTFVFGLSNTWAGPELKDSLFVLAIGAWAVSMRLLAGGFDSLDRRFLRKP